ncbi:MAG: DUF1311 domain-containing protein [Marinovum sp.]|nr:DUF1311 domain-containing protein [Marinovum sp.]
MRHIFAITIAILWLAGQGARADILTLSEAGKKTPNQMHIDAIVAQCFETADRRSAKAACAGRASDLCMDADQNWGHTTLGMMLCKMAETTAWSKIVGTELALTLDDFEKADSFDRENAHIDLPYRVPSLKETHASWQTYKTAKCQSEYLTWRGGTLAKIAGANCDLNMTADHALFLWSLRQP